MAEWVVLVTVALTTTGPMTLLLSTEVAAPPRVVGTMGARLALMELVVRLTGVPLGAGLPLMVTLTCKGMALATSCTLLAATGLVKPTARGPG